ncbi:hypothetical protein [Candidatus Williamhamiltonella defendens]|nr:hypothetical protein [Candidatus Hamiltonella defensa]
MESHKVFLFLLTLFPSLLSATSDINTVGELDALQSQITWYKALSERNKAKDEVGLTGSLDRSPTSEGLLGVIRLITRRDRALSLNELGLTAPQ